MIQLVFRQLSKSAIEKNFKLLSRKKKLKLKAYNLTEKLVRNIKINNNYTYEL